MKKRLNLICLGIVLAVLVSMSFLFHQRNRYGYQRERRFHRVYSSFYQHDRNSERKSGCYRFHIPFIAGLDGNDMLHLCHSPIRQNDSEHPPQHHFRLGERETPAPVGLFAYPLLLLLVGDIRHQQSFSLSSDKFEGL